MHGVNILQMDTWRRLAEDGETYCGDVGLCPSDHVIWLVIYVIMRFCHLAYTEIIMIM